MQMGVHKISRDFFLVHWQSQDESNNGAGKAYGFVSLVIRI